jgi:hypothetical protein
MLHLVGFISGVTLAGVGIDLGSFTIGFFGAALTVGTLGSAFFRYLGGKVVV